MLIFAFVSIFLNFIPILFTENNGVFSFVNGFQSFVYLEDQGAEHLYPAIASFLISFVLGVMVLPFCGYGVFQEDKKKLKVVGLTSFIFLVGKLVASIVSLVELFQCSQYKIYPEVGSYIILILTALCVIATLVLYLLFDRKSKAKN